MKIMQTLIPKIKLSCAVLLVAPSSAAAAFGQPAQDRPWQQYVIPAVPSTRVLAMAANREYSAISLLYAETESGNGDQLHLLTFNDAGRPLKSVNLAPALRSAGPLEMHTHAGLTVGDNGTAYVAVAAQAGRVCLASVAPSSTAASLVKVLKIGEGSVQVMAMHLSRQGTLMLAGSADDKGFVASVSPQGKLNWTTHYDKVVTVLDIAESGNGFVLAGGTPGKMFPQSVWIARIGASGEELESQLRPGPTRYAYLAGDGQRIGLSFERLGPDLESGQALLAVFASDTALRETASHVLFEGRLDAPFALSASAGHFTAAGVAENGVLRIAEVGAGEKIIPLFIGQVKAPEYVRFLSVEIMRSPSAIYFSGLRSKMDGRSQQLELVFAYLPVKSKPTK